MLHSHKFQVLLSLLVLFAGACETHSPPTTGAEQLPGGGAVDSTKLQQQHDSLEALANAVDTFSVNTGRVFRIEVITESQYDRVVRSEKEHSFPPDSMAAVATEATYLKLAGGRVWRSADSLFFKTEQGTVIKLQDGPTYQDAEDSYEGYRFLDNLSTIGQWLVEVGQWEGMHYLLIDQQTGKRTDLIGYPSVSPDRLRFVCANSSPTGYNLNGVQLWVKPQGASPQLLWQRVSDSMHSGIAALSPKWENPKTLLLYEDFIVAGRYVRIHI